MCQSTLSGDFNIYKGLKKKINYHKLFCKYMMITTKEPWMIFLVIKVISLNTSLNFGDFNIYKGLKKSTITNCFVGT